MTPLGHRIKRLTRPDIARARALLGWHPQVDLHTGLARTVEWFRQALSDAGPVPRQGYATVAPVQPARVGRASEPTVAAGGQAEALAAARSASHSA